MTGIVRLPDAGLALPQPVLRAGPEGASGVAPLSLPEETTASLDASPGVITIVCPPEPPVPVEVMLPDEPPALVCPPLCPPCPAGAGFEVVVESSPHPARGAVASSPTRSRLPPA